MEHNEETEEATNQVINLLEEWGSNLNLSGLGNYIELQISIKDYFEIFSMN